MIEPIAAIPALGNSEALFQQAASRVANSYAAPVGSGDTADLSGAAVSLIQSRNNFEAVTQLVKVELEVGRSLLNVAG